MPAQAPLSIYRGDSYHWTFTLFTDDAGTDPYDLTGTTAKAEIRDRPGGAVLAVPGCSITLPNTIDVALDSVESGKLAGPAVWDLQLTSTTGSPPTVKTVVAGSVALVGDVTDSTRP